MVQQITNWWHGIVFRSLAKVTLATLLLGGVSSVLIHRQVTERVHQEALAGLTELLDTVESTASVAAFANDAQLATEVAQGLLRNSDVLSVTLSAGGIELANTQAKTKPVDNQNAIQRNVLRTLYSPFKKNSVIGEIALEVNWAVISQRVAENAYYTLLLLAGQLLLIIIGTAGMVFIVVVRPIKATSDRLHRLDAASGNTLAVPDGHQRTEIGRLVGDINGLTGRLVNTLEQERALRQQQEVAKRMYQDLFDHASSGIFVADPQGRLASFNTAFVELTRLQHGAMASVRHLTEPGWGDSAHLLELLARSADQHISCEDDFLLMDLRGIERWLHVVVMPLGDGNVQGTVTDVSARKREELSARRLAITDSLTGFANREGLLQNFAALQGCSDEHCSIVMVNLDAFKQINDAMGFPIGDQLLLKVAERIRVQCKEGDFLSRIGGDEFVIVWNGGSDRDTLRPRIEALLRSLREPYRLEHGPVSIGASLGIAFFPQHGVDMPQLLRSSELALNSVRASSHAGSDKAFEFFDQQLQVVVEHRRRMEDDLRLAVNGGHLRLAFQPIVDLHAGRLAGAEALVRWQDTERGFVSPEVFIPMAERVGLIGEIGRQVLEEACRQVAGWRREGLDMYVSVNVSVRQIPDELPVDTVLAVLQRYGLSNEAIAIEITEGVLMSDISIAQSWIEQLRAAGIRIFLDDFGTGYSSLSYLKRFQMDTVKIDKSFITDMNANNNDRTLVKAIISMAASLGMKVVAEGVEEASQLALLREMGCGYVQGYYFSRPIPAHDFAATAMRINAQLT